MQPFLSSVWFTIALAGWASAEPARLTVSVPPGTDAATGRLVVAFAPVGTSPRFTDPAARNVVVVGQDATLAPDTPATVTGTGDGTAVFPVKSAFADLPPGEYAVRAVFLTNQDVWRPDAPGNRTGSAAKLTLSADQPALLVLDAVTPDTTPPDTDTHHYLSLKSAKLSAFHGREMVVRVAVVVPKELESDTTARLLCVHVGGFGQRFTSARRLTPDSRFVQLMLDGAGPFGDPYQVNSAVNGPFGDALIEEVLPEIEKRFRCGGAGRRFVTGGSTGGWVALALQVFYPDVFNGCWAQCPDGIDFRAFQLTDLSQDANMYVNRFGIERAGKRTLDGDTVYTVRREVQLESVLGRGGRWELGGQQWASWNAVYGPRAADGTPTPLWAGDTGTIDPAVARQWEPYDLRKVVVRNWSTLGPKLAGGKANIWVGDADDYFLNNAVHRFRDAAAKLRNPAFDGVIEIAPRQGHTSGWSRKQVLDAMAGRGEKPGPSPSE